MPQNVQSLPDLNCACANLRRAARLVTQLYSQEMGDRMEPAQFSLMTALSQHPGANQAQLGRALGLDKTTMSRNLRVLKRNGWIEAGIAADLRERGYKLTAAGKKSLKAAKPGWLRAQAKLRDALQPGEWDAMGNLAGRIANAVVHCYHGT